MAKNCDESEKEVGDWRENESEDRAKMQPLPRKFCSEINEYKREE